jgi:hypothetical protein
MQLAAGTRERRHNGANRKRSDRSNLFVGATFELPKDKDFPETWRQRLKRKDETLPFVNRNGEGFRRGASPQVYLFVEFRAQFHRSILLQPGVASVAYDLQQPGTRVSAVKAAEETARPEQCFLSDVLGISAPAQKPTREVESGVDVRQHQLLKALPVFELQLTHNAPLNTKAS